ncbi:MAG TPA: DUF2254 domain-containing protein [Ilumatobacteraceae bacterium]|nr:DUF2254 domain-containing protein [Ilumatobacteraceae bacterium]
MWRWPVVSGVIAVPVAWALGSVRVEPDAVVGLSAIGDQDAARAMFQLTATAVMAATTLTFSVTLLALQMASQQFSPRLLREFAHDPVTKLVLCVLTASFTFSSAALLLLDGDEPAPALSMIAAFLLGAASFVAILGFITHMLRAVRVDTMMLNVHDDTVTAIELFHPPDDEPSPPMPDTLDGPGEVVTADRSGFVQAIDVHAIVEAARSHDVFVCVDVRAGDQVIEGTPVATGWGPGDIAADVRRAVLIGYERTNDQDVAFGFRQLEDIAVKAMSPSINDPVTAAHAVGHMGALLVRLLRRRLGFTVHEDVDGVPRAVVPDRDLRYYLDLTCGQLRRFGQSEPSVLAAMLRMLRDVAYASRDDEQRCEVRRAAQLVVTQASGIRDADMEILSQLGHQVDLALSGTPGAYDDRAGETRSL